MTKEENNAWEEYREAKITESLEVYSTKQVLRLQGQILALLSMIPHTDGKEEVFAEKFDKYLNKLIIPAARKEICDRLEEMSETDKLIKMSERRSESILKDMFKFADKR